ncbi:MAG: alpha/beta hydrolase [Clostridia bacterium]|nr:alpha/beta hydrolase [Clostridia bacterium]
MDECPGQAEPSLTLYRAGGTQAPDAAQSCGVVLVCPGGGYHYKAPHEGEPVARMINEAGIDAAVLDYRVAPCPHSVPLLDCQRAIRLLRSMRYTRVAVLGFSAGGNLACNAAVHYDDGAYFEDDFTDCMSCRPNALISCYSVVSMAQHTHVGSLMNLLGEQHSNTALQRYYSAELNVTRDTPPAFIWHTAEDASVPVENSLNLAAALSRCGVPYEMHIFPEGRHGLGLAQEHPAKAWTSLCKDWLIRQNFDEKLVFTDTNEYTGKEDE